MDEQIQFEDTAKVEVPTTPQPHNTTLPSESDIVKTAVSESPTSSMVVANPSSPPTSCDAGSLPATVPKSVDPKYSSPPPPSSITPPPSSQPQKRQSSSSAFDRDITPTPATLSSPPPTVSYDAKRGAGRPLPISAIQLATASASELRESLEAALNENSRLDAEVHEERMAAAHYKLQHSLLVIETEEAMKRMEVEHEMTRREVEILQAAELARREASSQPPEQPSASARYTSELKAYCETMDKENALLHRRLDRAKTIIAEKEEDINDLLSENHRYVGRIRENREHMRLLRSPGGLYAAAASTPRTQSQNFPTTPQYTRATPKHTPHSIHQHDNQDSFATLLLADRVLNDQNSAPTTPTMTRFTQRSNNHVKHSRNVQSMSSLPSTPVRNSGNSQHLLPSVQFVPQSEPRYRTNQEFFSPAQPARTALPHGRSEKRRKSRDSTISASDHEELAAYSQPQSHQSQERRHSDDTEELDSDDVHESQASAAASEMLRRDPRQSFEVAASPGLTEATEKGALLQAKIFGSVTKGSSVPKRMRLPDDEEVKAKKLRMAAGEGVGLGIYGA